MRRISLSITIAVLFVLLLFVAVAVGQSSAPLSRIQPLLLNISQSVPLTLTLSVPTGPTNTLTVTVPAVVDVNIDVRLTSELTPVVEVAPVGSPLVTVRQLLSEGSPLTDNNGTPYEIEIPEGINVIQFTASPGVYGGWVALGELRNTSEQDTLSTIAIWVSMYDEEGNLLDVAYGGMKLTNVPPGGTSPFSISGNLDPEEFARYLIQIEPRFDR